MDHDEPQKSCILGPGRLVILCYGAFFIVLFGVPRIIGGIVIILGIVIAVSFAIFWKRESHLEQDIESLIVSEVVCCSSNKNTFESAPELQNLEFDHFCDEDEMTTNRKYPYIIGGTEQTTRDEAVLPPGERGGKVVKIECNETIENTQDDAHSNAYKQVV